MNFIPSQLDLMVQWIVERESIRIKKERGDPKPWTSDLIMRDHRWCNVRRFDDRVSQELLHGWYQAGFDGAVNLPAAVLARLINRTDSLMEITGGERFTLADLPKARAALSAREARGEKVFTAAYIIPGVPGRRKIDSVCDLVEKVTEKSQEVIKSTMRETWAELTKFDGLGSFLAGQVVADLAELEVGRRWADATTFAPVGPGSARGMNRLLGIPTEKRIAQTEFDELLNVLIPVLRPRIESIWNDRKLIAFDVQNCLCEFSKVSKLRLKEGTVRSRYPGAGQPQLELIEC